MAKLFTTPTLRYSSEEHEWVEADGRLFPRRWFCGNIFSQWFDADQTKYIRVHVESRYVPESIRVEKTDRYHDGKGYVFLGKGAPEENYTYLLRSTHAALDELPRVFYAWVEEVELGEVEEVELGEED